jgi:hypothetical protein
LGVFVLLILVSASFPMIAGASAHCDITMFGAVGDGATQNAPAIQKAINSCAAAGGGVVEVPRGRFLTGALTLRSHITLRLAQGAVLLGSPNLADYHPAHLLYAEDADNLVIEGEGTIDGNGRAFWDERFRAKPRPGPLLRMVRCRNVRIRNIHIRNTPSWGIHPVQCDGVWIQGITMISDMRGPNTDGIDPDSSRNVFISDSYIDTGDDAICLKSSTFDGVAVPVENISITNCILASEDTAIKIGTRSDAGFRHIVVSNTVIFGSRYGIGFYVKDGGTVEDVRFSNLTIDTSVEHFTKRTGVARSWTEYPIFIDLEKRGAGSKVGQIRDVVFDGISIRGEGRVVVAGMPDHPVEHLTFRNIRMRMTGFENIAKERKPRGVKDMPPAARDSDYAPAPAAFVFANARELELENLNLIWDAGTAAEERHAIFASNVDGLYVDGFVGGPAGRTLAAIGLERVRNAVITRARGASGLSVFVGLRDTPADQVELSGNRTGKAREWVNGSVYQHLP